MSETATPQRPSWHLDPISRSLSERLTRELAGQVPPETVIRCVQAARHAVRFFGEEPAELPKVLERIVRADLQQVIDGRDSNARIYGVQRRRSGPDGASA